MSTVGLLNLLSHGKCYSEKDLKKQKPLIFQLRPSQSSNQIMIMNQTATWNPCHKTMNMN